jgi:hypothetical protein
MAKKQRTFADKLKKEKEVAYCKKCGGAIQPVLHVKSEWSENTNAWKFRQKIVKVCKCNQKEVYG